MNRDLQLKKNENKFIFLVCGDGKTGKKTIVEKFLSNFKIESHEEKSFYESYRFHLEYSSQNEQIMIPAEIRILHSEELSSDLKTLKSFYEGALGAFVVVSLEDFKYFTKYIINDINIIVELNGKKTLIICVVSPINFHFPLSFLLISVI